MEKSGQSQLVLFLIPLRSLVTTPVVFSAGIKGGGPKQSWHPERGQWESAKHQPPSPTSTEEGKV